MAGRQFRNWCPFGERKLPVCYRFSLAHAWVNIRGIRQAAAVSTAFTVSKLIPLFVFVAVGLFFIEPRSLHVGSLPPQMICRPPSC
jgi:amino acid transporter